MAISWKNPGNRTKYQEIATSGFALLAMTWKIEPGPSAVGAEADTPGGVSLQASILVLLRRLEHHTAVTVGRSACGRPTIHGGDWDDRKGRPYAKNPCGPASLRMVSLILHLQLQEQSFPGVQGQCHMIFIQLCPADGVAQDVALDAPCAHGTQGEGDGLLLRFR